MITLPIILQFFSNISNPKIIKLRYHNSSIYVLVILLVIPDVVILVIYSNSFIELKAIEFNSVVRAFYVIYLTFVALRDSGPGHWSAHRILIIIAFMCSAHSFYFFSRFLFPFKSNTIFSITSLFCFILAGIFGFISVYQWSYVIRPNPTLPNTQPLPYSLNIYRNNIRLFAFSMLYIWWIFISTYDVISYQEQKFANQPLLIIMNMLSYSVYYLILITTEGNIFQNEFIRTQVSVIALN